jgi:hypothetical protein
MSQPILCESSFVPAVEGHGGQHRSLQVMEILRCGGFEPRALAESVTGSRALRLFDGARQLLENPQPLRNAHKRIGALGYHAERVRQALRQFAAPRVLVWERTREHLLGQTARRAGVRVVALPQNLESMVHGQRDPLTGETPPASFETELRALGAADAIFTISREEQWLLSLRGMDADYLPYHPPEPLRDKLLAVRRSRRAPGRFLVLGTVNNPPTEAGMRVQLELLEGIARSSNLQVDVVGYGTERLARTSQHLAFHGALSNPKLEELLLEARALLLHQRAAAGAVTRIPEMLVAGVPIIGNPIACRSAHDLDGVHCYEDARGLAALMAQPLQTPPVPEPPRASEERLLDCIRRLSG